MTRPTSLHRAWLAGLTAWLVIAGCGDPQLWQRYRAERLLWQGRRLAAIAASGIDASGATESHAAIAFDRVVHAFPPERWATRDALRTARGRDIALVSGTAALLRVGLDERAGHDAAAVRGYTAIATRYAAVDSVAVAARAGTARCLELVGRNEQAAAAWLELAQRCVDLDSARVAPWSVRLTAPGETARLLRHLGRGAEADSVLQAAAVRLGAAAARLKGEPIADDLWEALATVRQQAGQLEAARAALRQSLFEPGPIDRRPPRVLELAQLAREARLPDTALVYAAWASREFAGPVAREATLTLAHAWEDAGIADSALAVYKRLIEVLPPMGDLAARARLDRALLLERIQHWEAARAELRALAMMQPTHPCGEAALVEIVRYHVREGEPVFAAVEAKHAMTTFDQLLATQGDMSLRLETMMARAEVRALMGQSQQAQRDYAEAWRLYASLPAAASAGWRAARLADSVLAAPAEALQLYRDLAARSADREVRWQARQLLNAAVASRSRR